MQARFILSGPIIHNKLKGEIMTCQEDCSQFDLAMELLITNSFGNVAELPAENG
jgi:hypothetical protein